MCSLPPTGSPTAAQSAGLGARGYWRLSILLIGMWLVLWLAAFPYLYGWQADDWAVYVKGQDTIADPSAAFTNRANLMQPYFFLYTYLPIKSGLSITSHPLPIYGPNLGNFRFLVLLTILYHGVIALVWVWFVLRICADRWAALLSLAMLLVGSQYVLWTPQLDTRLIGLPFILVGIWLLLKPVSDLPGAAGVRATQFFLAGSLFGLAQSLHYTSLYLIVPASLVLCLRELWHRWRQLRFWSSWLAFALGAIWLQAVLEIISGWVLHIPFKLGPTMSLINQAVQIRSPLDRWETLHVWWEYLATFLGLPMLIACALGGVRYVVYRGTPVGPTRPERLAIVGIVAVGLLEMLLSRSMPFFRKTCVLQPFLFLFAAVGVIGLAQRIAASRWRRGAICAAATIAINLVPVSQSISVFRGSLGLGEVLAWADRNKGDRKLRWLVSRLPHCYSPVDLQQDDPRNWLVTYCPLEWLVNHPTLCYFLRQVPPLESRPTLWSTLEVQHHHYSISHTDLTKDPIAGEARIYRVGDLQQAMRVHGELKVEGVTADSQASPAHEPVNVFDGDASPDHATSWISADVSGSHYLEISLGAATPLDTLAVVLGPWRSPRVCSLEVQGSVAQGEYQTIWSGGDLRQQQVIVAHWPKRELKQLKIVIHGQALGILPSNSIKIEEIIFPGFRVIPPAARRKFPDLVLHRVVRRGGELVAEGANIIEETQLILDEKPLPTSRDAVPIRIPNTLLIGYYPSSRMHAVCPAPSAGTASSTTEVYLADPLRRSNSLRVSRSELQGGGDPIAATRSVKR